MVRFAIVEDGVVANIAVAESALSENWIQSNTANVGDTYDSGEFTRPIVTPSIPSEVTALQGMLAIDQSGLSAAFESWANDPLRTFAERAFISKALVWKRNDPVLIAGAQAMGITDQLDQLFILASTL